MNMKIVYGMMLLLPLWACDKPGPRERAGEEVDAAVQALRTGGAPTGTPVADAVDDVRDGVPAARREL